MEITPALKAALDEMNTTLGLVRQVQERIDTNPFPPQFHTGYDRWFLKKYEDRYEAARATVLTLGPHSPEVRNRAGTRHLAKARERLAAAKATTPKKRTG